MKYTLTLQQSHLEQVKLLIHKPDKKERAAIILCGNSFIENDPWDGGSEHRFLSREVIEIPDESIIDNSETHVKWDTAILRAAMKKAKLESLSICLVHSHPDGYKQFSTTDDDNERELFETIYARNNQQTPNLSMVSCPDGTLFARSCTHLLKYHTIDFIRVYGDRFAFHYPDKYTLFTKEEFHRQTLAFGPALTTDLSKLRVAVIGCGATGSATAHLLTRLGVGKILLIDKDQVERSNLSRLYGPTSADADFGAYKAETVAKFLSTIGIGSRIRYFNSWVGDPVCRQSLKSCDLVFSCTDDNSGRIFLNRYAYFYLTPVIDMGISIDTREKPVFAIQSALGRMTMIQPGTCCMLCRQIVNPVFAREEDLKRSNPIGFNKQKEEAYVVGSGNPNPAVITFTTEVATMSTSELINRISGYKAMPPENHVVRFFHQGLDRRPAGVNNPECPICVDKYYWGIGDVNPFLDIIL